MSRILYLMSSGSHSENYEGLLPHIKRPLAQCKVYLITTASDVEEDKTYMEFYQPAMERVGLKNIVTYDLKNKTQQDLEKDFADADIIFVAGGNTFYLLDYIRKSGFDKIINQLLDRGVIYIGSSAGSYVCCPSIEMATWAHQDRNRVGITDLTGMNLVPFLVSAHFTEEVKVIIEEEVKKTKYQVIVLTNKQSILCIDDTHEIVGVGEKLIYNEV